MKFDLHTHHERCGHAKGSIREYVEAAIDGGLKVIGISDHSPYFAHEEDRPNPRLTMATSEFNTYVEEVLSLKKEYEDKIEVLLGMESDFLPDVAHVYRRVLESKPFDYIIGSVHDVEEIRIFDRNRWKGLNEQEQIELKELYYDLIEQSARSGMFDILGHIDAMKGNYPEFSNIPTHRIDTSLKVISECDVVIEINTSGKSKDVGGWYPSDEILEKALFYGVKVTFGSDAHVPASVADEFERVSKRLKEIGFKEWACFRKRQRYMIEL
ncbi:histidinol-phosphatase [Chengkuizengella axinellae]|uniref:Histidinol-phosphatase n=1 Tax=Chengkuizengella axinellae TaxID=3064388 RepID=A0ABT9J2Y8_9BACL|nr:histidinol-phosphatase [Chengkuizengella sp. 2205SS18-9]MDP5275928.1 histidinol-phosphatase [Chengkuizengella sp. 2205SS18-9]